ncbi:MAG: outer membrane beta-barrel protein [Spirosomataceae bacterium]
MIRTFFLLIFSLNTWMMLHAQDIRSNTEGLNVTVSGGIGNWSSNYFLNLDELEPLGVGGGLRIGYGLNQRFELFARYDRHTFKIKNDWEQYGLSNAGAGVRVNFGGTLQALRPYVEAGFSSINLKIDPVLFNGRIVDYRLKGPALALGGGVNYFISPNFSVQAAVAGTFGKFTTFQINGDGIEDRPDARTLRFSLGISYFFNQ